MAVFGLTHTLPRMLELATLEVPGLTSVACPTRNARLAAQSSCSGFFNDNVNVFDWPCVVLVSNVTLPNAGFAFALIVLEHLDLSPQNSRRPSGPTPVGE